MSLGVKLGDVRALIAVGDASTGRRIHREQHQVRGHGLLSRCPGLDHLCRLPTARARPSAAWTFAAVFPPCRRTPWSRSLSALAALLVARRGAQLDRPVGPDERLVLLLGRHRQQLELGHALRAVAVARATQSLPVSPPPMTMTCLPPRRWPLTLSPALTLFCCGGNSIAKWMPSRSRPGTGRSRGLGAAAVRRTASNLALQVGRRDVSLGPVGPCCRRVRADEDAGAGTSRPRPASARRGGRSRFSILKSGMP